MAIDSISSSAIADLINLAKEQGTIANPVERPTSKFWINVGIPIEIPNEETGELEQMVITLPFGIPLDGMKEAKVPAPNGKNDRYRHIMQAKNQLAKNVMAKAEQLSGGEAVQLPLVVELRRINEENHSDLSDSSANPFLAAMTL